MNEAAPADVIGLTWLGFFVSWLLAAAWSRATVARPSYGQEFPNRLVTVLGAALMFVTLFRGYALFPALFTPSAVFSWAMFGCVVLGIAFAWWARLHLGALWSGNITVKQDHRIVDTGPYGLVRHPIYTGVLFSLYATALERGRVEPLFGAVLMSVGFWMKARLEETFLVQALGESAYASYRARVPMLVPFVKGGLR